MYRIVFSVFLLVSWLIPRVSIAHAHLMFKAERRDYTFSTVFELDCDSESLGSIVKSSFRIRTNYDLYTSSGEYNGVGICRLLTLGAFYKWGTEIDIYDERGDWIGMIDGQVVTEASAKFSIYDRAENVVGIAYLDRTDSAFTITDPNNAQKHIANLRRHFVEGAIDSWDVQVFDKKTIDLRILKVFTAFAVDSQGFFKKDI